MTLLPRPDTSQAQQPELLSPPVTAEPSSGRLNLRAPKLGRSASVNSGENFGRRPGRRGVSEGSSIQQSTINQGSELRPSVSERPQHDGAASDVETSTARSMPASRTRSLGHARRESIQARRARREQSRTSAVAEETDQEIQDEIEGRDSGGQSSPNGMKPVYLKGLFSVSTTSSKPLPIIRTDIIRVLRQLGVEYREIKGGFSCRHAPSIDMQKAEEAETRPQQSNHRRKISFSFIGGGPDRDPHDVREAQRQQPPTPSSTARTMRAPDRSYTNSEDSDSNENDEGPGEPVSKSTSRKDNHSHSRAAGETSTHVQSDLGEGMALRFEIFVVKVPLLSLHGIQFKKVDGGTWQYKNMAQTILNELRL
ncbi:Serine/threonine-protein kinase [Taxawa tesnikishii (nom. ined.)]|nr:Serine/threonine-protein kinase [Dothideales sp. JES 119]